MLIWTEHIFVYPKKWHEHPYQNFYKYTHPPRPETYFFEKPTGEVRTIMVLMAAYDIL